MKALVYTRPNEVQLQERPAPELAGGEVVLKIEAVGICGSDMHAWHGHDPRRLPGLVLGHEFVGRIEHSAAPGFAPGTRYTGNPLITLNTTVLPQSVFVISTNHYLISGSGTIEVRDGLVYITGGDTLITETRLAVAHSPFGWDGSRFSVLNNRWAHPATTPHRLATHCSGSNRRARLTAPITARRMTASRCSARTRWTK